MEDGGDDFAFVFWVGDAEPFAGGLHHVDICDALFDQDIDFFWDVALGLEVLTVGFKKLGKGGAQTLKDVWGKAEEVHGDDLVTGEGDGVFWVFAVFGTGVGAEDFGHFGDGGELCVGVGGADSSRDAAEVGEGIFQVETDHRIVGFAVVRTRLDEVGGDFFEGIAAVEVVGIDHEEGFGDDGLGGENGVGGAPGFGAAFGNGEGGGEVVEVLEGVFDVDSVGKAGADLVAELGFEIAADDEDDFAEASADGIEDGVVEDDFTGGAHGVELFEAAVTAAHACGKDEEGGFGHDWRTTR